MAENLIPLKTLIPKEKVPEALGLLKDGIDNLFDGLFISDLQGQISQYKGNTNFIFNLIAIKKVSVEILGIKDFDLILNPGYTGERTELPATLSYSWPILNYIETFEIHTFDFSPKAFFDVFIKIGDTKNYELLSYLVENFYPWTTYHGDDTEPDPEDEFDTRTPVEKFVDDFNLRHNPTTALVLPPNPVDPSAIEDLIEQLTSNGNSFDIIEIAFADYILNSDTKKTLYNIEMLFMSLNGMTIESVKGILIPKISIAFESIILALEFPRTVLKPIDPETNEVISNENIKSQLSFNAGSLYFSSTAGFEFTKLSNFNFSKSQIGNTGLTLEFTNMKLDLSRTKSIPEAEAAGYATDFVGVFVEEAIIGLPKKLFKDNPNNNNPDVSIFGRNLLIGTGGISGTIGLEAAPGNEETPFHQKIGSIDVALERFDITFKQNSIVSSNIEGYIKVPGFKDASGSDAQLDIDVHIADDGDFSITVKESDGIKMSIENVFEFTIKSAELGKRDDKFYIAVSGLLEFADQGGFLGKFLPSKIDIKRLVIWEDGTIEFEGGGLSLPTSVSVKIGPAEISITAIHIGSHEQSHNGVKRKYQYFGFDGGISVNPGGVDARGDGVKLYYTVDGGPIHVFIRLQGMAIDIVLPVGASKEKAAIIISGYLSMKDPETDDPDAGRELAGGVSITLPKPGIKGSAAMRYNPKVPSFIVDLALELPVPIPIFPPVGIYGFRGLLGRRYVASRQHIGLAADASWYLYYKKKVAPENKEGVFISKFDKSKEGFSLGVGASIATTGDNGYTFSSKVFFLLSLPEVFLIQGQAAILKKRVGLDTATDPPFSAVIAISNNSIEASFGINYKLPDNGNIIQVNALAEMAYFKKNASAWYVNIGRDLPESKRVQAKLLSMFNMYSYLMLSSRGIRLGAGAKYHLKKRFGPIRLELKAYLDLTSKLSLRPVQLGGGIYLGGSVKLKIFRFKFGFSVDAGLAIEAPKPFIISGYVKVCIRVLRKRRCAKISFTFTFNKNIDNSKIEFLDIKNIMGVNAATGETFLLNFTNPTDKEVTLPSPTSKSWLGGSFDKYIVPLDTHVDFEFNKGIGLGTAITNIGKAAQAFQNYELFPPKKGKSPQVRHTYTVESVRIRIWKASESAWKDYDIYQALTPLQDAPFISPAVLATLKAGWLQLDTDGKYKRLRMLSLSPLSYVNQGVDISTFTLEDLGLSEKDLFCPPPKIQKTCFNYEANSIGSAIITDRIQSATDVVIRVLSASEIIEQRKVVSSINSFGLSRGLLLASGDQYELIFKRAMAQVNLRLSTSSEYVTIAYYKLDQIGETVSQQPQYGYTLIKSETLQPSALLEEIEYDDIDIPVTKIVVTAGPCSLGGDDGDEDDDGDTGGDGGDDDGDDDHDCSCDCVKCCGGPAINKGIPKSSGKEVGSLVNLYKTSLEKKNVVLSKIDTLNRELSVNTSSMTRLMSAPATSTQQNDNRLQASRFRFRKEELEEEIDTLQFHVDQLDNTVNQIKPLVKLIEQEGEDSDGVTTLANSIYNGGDGEADFTCSTIFFQVCYLSVDDYLLNQTTPSTEEVVFDLSSVTDGYSKTVHPIWRPDSYYAITIKTKDQVTVQEKTSANKTYEQYFSVGFQTKGPLGHFHSFDKRYKALKAKDKEDEFLLASLRPYIDYAKSFPNPDGRLTNAKPLFFNSPKLYLFYKFAHIYGMYGDFAAYQGNAAKTSSLKVLIKDPSEPPGTDSELIIEQINVDFLTNDLPVQHPDSSFFNNLTRGSNCVQVVPVNPIGINTAVDPGPLKPLKLYSAIFFARYDGKDEEVHRFPFQTSRYKDFKDQIESYKILNDEGVFMRNAVYDNLAKTFTAPQLTKAAQLLGGTLPENDSLYSTYQHPYDLLMTGLFEFTALDPAARTEINIVRNSTDNAIIGLLIRNPEPLNDPKMSGTILINSVHLSVNGGLVTDNKKIFSKDNSSVFISNAGLSLSTGTYNFLFRYYQFNGANYAELENVSVTITI